MLPGLVTEGIAAFPAKPEQGKLVEHPMGEFTVQSVLCCQHGVMHNGKSGVTRTARLLRRGEVLVALAAL